MAKYLISLGILASIIIAALSTPIKINLNNSWRVVGGSDAPEGKYSCLTSLRKYASQRCAASILNEEWALTAAHCVLAYSSEYGWTIVAGTNRLNSGGDEYEVIHRIVHPDYSAKLTHNDIALFRVKGPIRFNKTVQPIALKSAVVGVRKTCTLSGWGATSNPGNFPNNLQHINLTTISNEDCQKAHTLSITDSQICTFTKEGEGACTGDSGGSLVRLGKIIGVMSWGTPCAVGYPDVFTRVSSYIDWVNKNCDNCATTI